MYSRALILAAAATFVACVAEREPEARFVPASRSVSDEELGARANRRPMTEPNSFAITRARCDREVHCLGIGPGKHFESRSTCERFYNDIDFDAFGPARCGGGFDQNGLSACARSIRAEICETSIDSLESLDDCQPKQVCR